MKIGQYCQRQRCSHVELEQFWQAFASRGFVSDSWAFLLYLLSSMWNCMGQNIKSLARVSVCAHGIGGRISRKRLDIELRFQWDTNRKWHMTNRLVTWLRIYDITWSWKVNVVTQTYSGSIISKMAADTFSVSIEHLQNGLESNGHVTEDVTWPWMVEVVAQVYLYWNTVSPRLLEIAALDSLCVLWTCVFLLHLYLPF